MRFELRNASLGLENSKLAFVLDHALNVKYPSVSAVLFENWPEILDLRFDITVPNETAIARETERGRAFLTFDSNTSQVAC